MPSITVVQHSPPEEPTAKSDASPATLPMMSALEVVAGRFEVRSVAGSGGNGVVYRALDRQSGAEVALKVLRRCEREDRARFVREAAALSTLAHAHVQRLSLIHI